MKRDIQALRGRLAVVAAAVRTLVEANTEGWKPEHQSQYDTGMAEVEDIKGQINREVALSNMLSDAHKLEQVEEEVLRATHKKDPKATFAAQMFVKWLKGGDNAISAQEWADIRATMSTTTTTEGGYTVQTTVASQLIDQLKMYGGIRNVATILSMDQGNPMSFPTSDGTSEVGELIAENTTATGADPTFGTLALNVYKFSSKIVAVPFELLQDSQIDIEGFVNNRLAQRLGRITNTYFTTGTGTAQPFGIVTRAGSGKVGTTGQTLTVIVDDLIDLVHSVDPAYRVANCSFMMHDQSLKIIRKLKDSTGRPIYIPGYEGLAGQMKDMLLGYPVDINQDVAQMAANAKSIMFGNLKQYYVRDVMNMTMFRFTDSAYAKLGQVGFLAWMRTGGNLLDASAVKYYANSAT
jgi:HK97 family phage major capsid protein